MARVRRDNDARYALRASFVDSNGDVIIGDTITIGGSSDDSRISDTDISNWNTAYGWGDHSTQGYYSGDVTLNCVAGLDVTNTNSTALEIYQPTAQADAMMAFHVAGDYAVNFGIDGSTNKLAVGGWSMGTNVYEIYHSGNPQTSITGNAATATTFSTTNANYKGVTDGAVAGQLMWKNYGNVHTIFDASQGTSPDGGAVNNTNSAAAWSATYPTLMGWNGAQTYGVRVDSARVSDTATTATNVTGLSKNVASYCSFSVNTPHNSWYGMGVAARLVMMHNNDTVGGLYNDNHNQWVLEYTENGSTGLYQAGAKKGYTYGSGWRVTGNMLATSNVYAYYSDKRLKDVKGQITEALDKVDAIETFYYTHNDTARDLGYEGEEMQVGVAAQSVQAVMPEVVHRAPVDDDGEGGSVSGEDYVTVDYPRLVPLLIEAIKELKAKVEELENGSNNRAAD